MAATEYCMLYPGGYKALYPTPGFPSAGTPSSLFPAFHPQARCLLTTSHIYHPSRHVYQTRHLPSCPRRLCQRRPSEASWSTYECTLPVSIVSPHINYSSPVSGPGGPPHRCRHSIKGSLLRGQICRGGWEGGGEYGESRCQSSGGENTRVIVVGYRQRVGDYP